MFLFLATAIHAIALYNDYWWVSPAHQYSSSSGKTINVSVKKTPATIAKATPTLPDISPATSKPPIEKRVETDATTTTTPSQKRSFNKLPAPQKNIQPSEQQPKPSEPSNDTEANIDTGIPSSKLTESAEHNNNSANSTDSSTHLFEQWLASLQFAINQNKAYPYPARRRNISGEVEIELEVAVDGSLLAARIIRGKKVFHKSTLKAVHSAFPMPPTHKSNPVVVHLMVHYSLK